MYLCHPQKFPGSGRCLCAGSAFCCLVFTLHFTRCLIPFAYFHYSRTCPISQYIQRARRSRLGLFVWCVFLCPRLQLRRTDRLCPHQRWIGVESLEFQLVFRLWNYSTALYFEYKRAAYMNFALWIACVYSRSSMGEYACILGVKQWDLRVSTVWFFAAGIICVVTTWDIAHIRSIILYIY